MYFADVKQVTVLDTHARCALTFHRRNAELHMILGELPVFARRWLQGQPLANHACSHRWPAGRILARYALGKYSVYPSAGRITGRASCQPARPV